MRSHAPQFNPGERLIVPLGDYPLTGFSCSSFDLQTPQATTEVLSRMGVTRTFLAISSFWNQPEELAAQVDALRSHVRILHDAGLTVGIWFWSDFCANGTPEPTQQVLVNGEVLNKLCPLDEAYLSGMESYVTAIASTGADALMIDDGFRYGFENKSFGCLCPLHLRAISKIIGRDVSAEEARSALLTGGENPIRSAFLRVNGDSLVGFAKRMRAAVDRIAPAVRFAVCSALSSWDIDGTDPETVARAFAGDTKPFLRTSGAPYWADHRSFRCRMEDIIEFERMQTALFAKPDMDVMWEGDSYPRPRWNCAASYLECFDLARAISDPSVHTLKYLLEYGSELRGEGGYLKRHLRNVPLYRAIAEHFDDKEPCGIRVFEVPHKYEHTDIPAHLENRDYELQLTCFNPASKILSPVGLPTVWSGEGTGIAVFGENAKYLPESDFGKGLILDARAAEILTARHVDVGLRQIGGTWEPETLSAFEHYLADDLHIMAFGQPIRKLTTDDRILPETVFRTADGNRTVVSSYRYENAAGQRFFVLCSDAYGSAERYHRIYSRSRLLARAAEWVSGKRLPAWTNGSPDLYLLCKKKADRLAVGLFNLFEDEAIDTEVFLDGKYSDITFFSGSGHLEDDRVVLDDIPPFGVVCFEVCGEETEKS